MNPIRSLTAAAGRLPDIARNLWTGLFPFRSTCRVLAVACAHCGAWTKPTRYAMPVALTCRRCLLAGLLAGPSTRTWRHTALTTLSPSRRDTP
jgi:hypothetical protein